MEPRRNLPPADASWWRRFRDVGGLGSLLLAVMFFLCADLMDLWPRDPLTYRLNQFVAGDIYSRVNFQVLSPKLLAEEEKKIEQSTPAVFAFDGDNIGKFIAMLQGFPDALKSSTQPADLPKVLREQWALEKASAIQAWRELASGSHKASFRKQVEELRDDLILTPVVEHIKYDEQQNRTARDVILVHDSQRVTKSKLDLIDNQNDKQIADKAKWIAGRFVPGIQEHFVSAVQEGLARQLHTLLAQPNYTYDLQASARETRSALAQLRAHPTPAVYETHAQGDLLVKANTRELSAEDLRTLGAEHDEYMRLERANSPHRWLLRLAGRAVVILLICSLLPIFIARQEKSLVRDHVRGFSIAMTLLVVLAINKAILFSYWDEPVAVVTVMMAAVVLTIAFTQRLALTVALVLSLLTVHQLRGDFGRFIILLAGSASVVLQLREIRSRSKLIEVGAVSAGVVFVAVCAVAFSRDMPWRVTMANAVWAGGAAVLVGVLAQGTLPLIERVFRVATSMTLLEWCDASKPLLRRLATDAPGTFNHCLQLGAICESAAEAIGARGLLARAGAYYHDIGKISKPEYFVENQAGAASPHAKLSPAMSLLIIVGHVKDGLEMARQYGLPAVLHEFIATHHGTTLVQYFYYAATEQRKADAQRAPDEVEFRYPGPRPRSKEAAILLLADAAESSVRAMPEPTPGRIENQVHAIVSRRLMDGQLDECDLTLREVHRVEASLVRSLCAVHHARIAYPKLAGQKALPAEFTDRGPSAQWATKPSTDGGCPDKEPSDSPATPESHVRTDQVDQAPDSAQSNTP